MLKHLVTLAFLLAFSPLVFAKLLHVGVMESEGTPVIGAIFDQPVVLPLTQLKVAQLAEKQLTQIPGKWIKGKDSNTAFFTQLEPDTHYQVQVNDSWRNKGMWDGEVSLDIFLPHLVPSVRFIGKGPLVSVTTNDSLPMEVVNTSEFNVEFLKVTDEYEFLRQVYWSNSISSWDLNYANASFDSIETFRYQAHSQPNQKKKIQIPLPDSSEKGLYVAVAKHAGSFDGEFAIAPFIRTNLGLHARLYPASAAVFVSQLDTGKAVTLGNYTLIYKVKNNKGYKIEKLQGQLNNNGLIQFDFHPERDALLIVETANDKVIIPFNEVALDLTEFNIAGARYQSLEAFIYSNRDLIRPGESLPFNILLREHDGQQAAKQPITVSLLRPDARELVRRRLTPGELADYQTSFTIPADAPLGRWSLEVRTDPSAKQPINKLYFNVQEFLPERMKLTFGDFAAAIPDNQNIEIPITGAYLYGAPATKNRVEVKAHYSYLHHPLKEFKSFYFGEGEEIATPLVETDGLELDEQGKGIVRLAARDVPYSGPVKVDIKVSLLENAGRAINRDQQVTLWPFTTQPGIRPLFADNRLASNQVAEFELINVNKNGEQIAGEMMAQLIYHENRYYWVREGGRWQSRNERNSYPVSAQKLRLRQGEVTKLNLSPDQWGEYELKVTDLTGKQSSSYHFYMGWANQAVVASKPDRVNIWLDKASYQTGDNLGAEIHAPFSGEAILTLEGNSLLTQQRVSLKKGNNPINLTLDPNWSRHDLYLSVTLLGQENKQIKRAVGVQYIPLDRKQRTLQVSVTAPEKTLPEQLLTVPIQVTGLNGQAAKVTLSAVDTGITNLSRYKPVDPAEFFFAQRRYSPDLIDLYSRIFQRYTDEFASIRYGGDMEMADISESRGARDLVELKAVTYMSEAVALDKQGKAEITLPMPDYNGEVSLVATVYSQDQFGQIQSLVKVAAPIVAELSFPPFMAPNDRSHLVLELTNMSGQEQAVDYQLYADSPLTLTVLDAPLSQTLTLADKAKRILKFGLSSEFGVIPATVGVKINSPSYQANRHWQLPVRPILPSKREVSSHILNAGESMTLSAESLNNVNSEGLISWLSLAAQPPINLPDIVNGLFDYPYGCLEQTTSRAFPLLYAKDKQLASDLGLAELTVDDIDSRLNNAILRIAGMQKGSGGFALWSEHGGEEIWLTPYVMEFLYQAKNAGYPVPENTLKRGTQRLQDYLVRADELYLDIVGQHQLFAARVYSGYVLSLYQPGKIKLGELWRLKKEFKQSKATLPLMQLAVALYLNGDEKGAGQSLLAALTVTRSDRYLGDYGSALRDAALELKVLQPLLDKASTQGQKAELAKVTNQLLLNIHRLKQGRRYYSTQEQFALLQAGLFIRSHFSTELSADVNGKAYQNNTSLKIASSLYEQGVTVTNTGESPLYLQNVSDGFIKDLTKFTSPVAATQFDKQLFNLDGSKLSGPMHVGQSAIMVIRVRPEQTLDQAMIIDLLPPGLALENHAIEQGTNISDVKVDNTPLSDLLDQYYIEREEFRQDRYIATSRLYKNTSRYFAYVVSAVSEGKYQLPPVFIEDMYAPEKRLISDDPGQLVILDSRAAKQQAQSNTCWLLCDQASDSQN